MRTGWQSRNVPHGWRFEPLRWPTREEYRNALHVTQYNQANFHFAIVGRAGSGKLSLINQRLPKSKEQRSRCSANGDQGDNPSNREVS